MLVDYEHEPIAMEANAVVFHNEAKLTWKVLDSKSSIRPIFDRVAKKSMAEADPLVEKAISGEHAQTLAYVRGKVATSSASIYSYFALGADDPSVQIVSNAQIAYVKRAMQGTEYEKYLVLSAAAPPVNSIRLTPWERPSRS